MDPDLETDGERLPGAILRRLRAKDRALPIVDARTDDAVLAAARAYFARRPERSAGARRRWAWGVAAAAAVVAAVFLLVRPTGVLSPARNADDVDGSGRVDILDAFSLARMRAAGRPIPQGRIDELAARIVSLDPGGRGR